MNEKAFDPICFAQIDFISRWLHKMDISTPHDDTLNIISVKKPPRQIK